MKFGKTLIIIVVLALLAAIGYYFWVNSNFQSKTLSQADLIPEDALLVYESTTPYKTLRTIGQGPIWRSLSSASIFNEVEKTLRYVDTLDRHRMRVIEYFEKTPVTVSLHVVSNNDFDLIYYFPLKSDEDMGLFKDVLAGMKKNSELKTRKRTFEKFEIQDLEMEGKSFSMMIAGNFLVGSYTGFLIEDVIRTVNDTEKQSLFQKHGNYFEVAKIQGDQGDLFFNVNQFPKLLTTIFAGESKLPLSESGNFSGPIFADIRWQEEEIFLSGATLNPPSEDDFLSLFAGDKPKDLVLAKLAPNNTAAFYEYGFSNGVEFLEKYKAYLKACGNDSLVQQWYELGQQNGIYMKPFFNHLKGNLGLAILEKHLSGEQPLIFMATINETDAVEDYFQKIREKVEYDSSEIIDEMYGDYYIREIPIEEFPSKLVGPFFSGFNRSFYLFHDSTLIISNRLAGLRSVVNSIEDESNWGKSVKMNLFFEKALNPANVSALFNIPRLFKSMLSNMQPYWARIFQENETQLKKFELVSAQWNHLDEKFYSNVAIKHSAFSLEESTAKEKHRIFMTNLPKEIAAKPKIVRNHSDKSLETLVQLEDGSLSLISRSGQILWNADIPDGPLVSEPIQIDYFKNGKLQYFMADAKNLYLVDRLGRMVEGFPIKMFDAGNQEIAFVNVIDYDNTRKYRFLVADNRGKVYLMDKTGGKLKGWAPKDIGKSLATTPFHTRINGKDIIVFLTKNGVLHALKRNGHYYSGFPINLDLPFSNPIFMVHGPGFSNSMMYLLSDDGTFLKISFMGKMISKSELIRETPESSFGLIISRQKEDFVIVRYEKEKIALISPEFDLMFQAKLLIDAKPLIQFYDFEGDHELFGVLERPVSKIRIFNKHGKEYGWSPLPADQEISILFYDDENELRVFKSFKSEYSAFNIKPD